MNFMALLFPDFSLIVIGYLVCRFTVLNRAVWSGVEQLVYFLFFPVLLFHAIVKSPLNVGAASHLVAAGWSVGLAGIALAYSVPHWPGLRGRVDPALHAANAQVAFRFNSFIGLAVIEKVSGPQGLAAMAILIGVSVPLMNIGAVWPMARHGQRGFARELARNPLILATLGGLLANLAGLQVPQWLEPTLSRIGAASLALGLMAAGAGMQWRALGQAKRLALALMAIRHLALPLLALGLSAWLGLSHLQAGVLLTFAALPTASSSYVLAVRMGFDGGLVAALVTLSTALGVLSLWWAIGVLWSLSN
jgi:hypothetical protein